MTGSSFFSRAGYVKEKSENEKIYAYVQEKETWLLFVQMKAYHSKEEVTKIGWNSEDRPSEKKITPRDIKIEYVTSRENTRHQDRTHEQTPSYSCITIPLFIDRYRQLLDKVKLIGLMAHQLLMII